MKWETEHLDTVRLMASDGRSASEIATVFDCSRNAVIGAAHRNQIHLRCVPAGPRQPPKVRKRKPRVYPTPYLPTPKPEPAPAVASQPCELVELTNATCRWIISEEGSPYLFCGAPEADLNGGCPYCRRHAAIAYQRRG